MFTASITKKNFSEGNLQVVVSFTDGTTTLERAFNANSESDLKSKVRTEIARLTELKELSERLPNGAYDGKDDPVEPVSQEEKEKQTWFRNFYRLEQLTKLQSLGALRPNIVADLDALRTTVSTDFKKSYIADM